MRTPASFAHDATIAGRTRESPTLDAALASARVGTTDPVALERPRTACGRACAERRAHDTPITFGAFQT
jgi:hypothetical protein